PGFAREPASHRTLDSRRREDDRVYRHDAGPDDVDETVDHQAGPDEANRQGESDLQGAPVPRGELRHAGVARGRAGRGKTVCRWPRPGSGHAVYCWMWRI